MLNFYLIVFENTYTYMKIVKTQSRLYHSIWSKSILFAYVLFLEWAKVILNFEINKVKESWDYLIFANCLRLFQNIMFYRILIQNALTKHL